MAAPGGGRERKTFSYHGTRRFSLFRRPGGPTRNYIIHRRIGILIKYKSAITRRLPHKFLPADITFRGVFSALNCSPSSRCTGCSDSSNHRFGLAVLLGNRGPYEYCAIGVLSVMELRWFRYWKQFHLKQFREACETYCSSVLMVSELITASIVSK